MDYVFVFNDDFNKCGNIFLMVLILVVHLFFP